MAHNYRGPSGRPDFRGGEQRYGQNWDDRPRESGYRSGAERTEAERQYRGEEYRGDYRNRGRSYYDTEPSDSASSWSEGRSGEESDDLYNRNRTTTSSWHEDQGDRGGYFGTGSYIDDGGASRGFGADFERARAQVQRRYGPPSERSWRNQPYDSGYPEPAIPNAAAGSTHNTQARHNRAEPTDTIPAIARTSAHTQAASAPTAVAAHRAINAPMSD
jgi:hypothetical protein